MIKKKTFLKHSFLYLLAMILPKAVNIFVLPIYTKFLEPEAYGIFSLTNSIIGVMAVLSSMGLNAFYLRNYASAKDKKELNGTIFWSMCIWNIILFIAGIIILPVIIRTLNMSVPFYPYMFLALVTQFFNSMEIIPMRTYRIRGEVKYYFIRILFKTILSAGFGITFVAIFKMGILGRYYAELINTFIFAVVFIVYMAKNSHFRIEKSLLKKAINFSLPIVPSDLLQMSTPMLINIVIERILSLAQLGVYSIGVTISSVVGLVTSSISLTVEPEIYKKSDSKDFPKFFIKLKNITIILVALISVGAGLFVREAAMILLSENYWDSWKVVQAVSISYIVVLLKGKFSQLAIIQGRTKMLFFSNLTYLLVSIIMSIILLKNFGENALGWPNIFGALASFIVLYISADKSGYEGLKLSRDFATIILSTLILYMSRITHSFEILFSIGYKLVIFVTYTVILLRLYNVSITQVVESFTDKKNLT